MKAWRPGIFGAIAVWSCGLIAGFYILMNYELTPGQLRTAPHKWPLASKIKMSGDRPTLVMLAHPQCPCTRASISELSQLMTRHRGKVLAYVLFLSPKTMPAGWEKTDLWSSAAAIPGVTVVADCDGAEARRFQAETSGQTLIYDVDGNLQFSGGITGSRGHIGDNVGLQAVSDILDKTPIKQQHSLVFGCSLFGCTVKDPLTPGGNSQTRYALQPIERRHPVR